MNSSFITSIILLANRYMELDVVCMRFSIFHIKWIFICWQCTRMRNETWWHLTNIANSVGVKKKERSTAAEIIMGWHVPNCNFRMKMHRLVRRRERGKFLYFRCKTCLYHSRGMCNEPINIG